MHSAVSGAEAHPTPAPVSDATPYNGYGIEGGPRTANVN